MCSSPRSRNGSIPSGNNTHGHDSLPQSYKGDSNNQYSADEIEYDGLLLTAKSPPRPNCCGWKAATLFLIFVAVALVLAWQIMPAEDIVSKYIPQFDEPENPYTGPEAGVPSADGGENEGDINIGSMPDEDDDNNNSAGLTVPSFMQCPEGTLCCNGSASNCNLRVDQMMFGLVHNAMSTEEGGFFIGYNHYLGLEKALVAGYRGLSLDVCNCDGVLKFCHNVCDLGERMPNEVFANTYQFLNDYPSEVIVLLFEASKDKGPILWNALYDEMASVEGFVDMIYVHKYGDEWPTMGTLVEQNKRIIVFYFNGGQCTDDTCPTGFEYFYNYAAETQYGSESLEDLEDYEYSCEITRGPKEGQLPPNFFVVNNFVTPPDPDASEVANSKSFLSSRLTACANRVKMRPNFVYLDFWSEGVTAQLVQYANAEYAKELER